MIAAMKSKSGKVGFIGGMDIPLIRQFACGYEQGAKHVSSDIEVVQNMTGTTPSAWNDPTRGSEPAQPQLDRGVAAIYAAPGRPGGGVSRTAGGPDNSATAVAPNQNYPHPATPPPPTP